MEGNRSSIIHEKTQFHSIVFGLVLTVGVNLAFYAILLFNGLSYMIPPPPEKSMVLDFVTEEPEPVVEEPAASPEDTEGTPVKKSEAPIEGKSAAKTEAASVGDKGDVEVPEPKREEVIDKMSLFRAPKHANKDTVADYTAKKAAVAFKDGNAEGKSADGQMDGTPTVNVGMRGARGKLPVPVYVGQESGTVVVEVTVDRNGNVCSATAGANGTTTTLKKLWNAAEKAAMDTKFNVDQSAPGLQTGTITYKFLLTDGN